MLSRAARPAAAPAWFELPISACLHGCRWIARHVILGRPSHRRCRSKLPTHHPEDRNSSTVFCPPDGRGRGVATSEAASLVSTLACLLAELALLPVPQLQSAAASHLQRSCVCCRRTCAAGGGGKRCSRQCGPKGSGPAVPFLGHD